MHRKAGRIMAHKHVEFANYPKFGVLSSLKVVVTAANVAGPFTGCLMAEAGAKVIHIEPPKAPTQTRSGYTHAQEHRNMYGVSLDVRGEHGRVVFEKLIEWADVWIEAGRAGSYSRMGFSDEHMWEINKKLAIVHISGFGQYGPYKDRSSYDVSGQAMSGYMYLNGTSPTSSPLKVNPFLSDYATAFNAAVAALGIVINARETGEGDAVDISQYETMFRMLSNYPIEWFNIGYPAPGEPVKWRTGNSSDQASGFSFYDCKDGTIFIGMVGEAAKRGHPIVGLPVPGTGDPDFPAEFTGGIINSPIGQRVEAAIKKYCAEHTVDEVEAAMNEAGVTNQRAYTPADIERDPQFAAREDIITWEDAVLGEVRGIGIVNKYTKNPGQIVASAPTHGEHSREVFEAMGFSQEFIEETFAAGESRYMDPRESAIYWRMKEKGFFWTEEQSRRLGL